MTISVRDRKRLWGLAASRCAFSDCRQALVDETEDGQGHVLLGQEAHIVADAFDGPRGQSDLPMNERDSYDNLILLCSRHHILVDHDVAAYPVDSLLTIKAEHELWVRRQLDVSFMEQALIERYGEIVDDWVQRAMIERWTAWSGDIANPTSPRLTRETMDRLTDLGVWMLAIIWPGVYAELERALQNFHHVLIDFKEVFDEQADAIGKDGAFLRAIPARLVRGDDQARLAERDHANLIVDLMLELTRAANHVCAMVRSHLDPRFRRREGVLLMSSGALGEQIMRPEYRQSDLTDLYPGLEKFRVVRATRELHVDTQE